MRGVEVIFPFVNPPAKKRKKGEQFTAAIFFSLRQTVFFERSSTGSLTPPNHQKQNTLHFYAAHLVCTHHSELPQAFLERCNTYIGDTPAATNVQALQLQQTTELLDAGVREQSTHIGSGFEAPEGSKMEEASIGDLLMVTEIQAQ